jgi:GR25 family glycosyltransferase involved in LPS biosynthesis
MTKVFSFCIYGNQKKYCQGLIENIELIKDYYPDFEVWIYGGVNVPSSYIDQYKSYDNVKYIETNKSGASLMSYRFFPIDDDNVEIMFSRDADSRINSRDRWCIDEFIKSEKNFHIIRDNYWHKTKITGGMWGIKQASLVRESSPPKQGLLKHKMTDLYNSWIADKQNVSDQYGIDQMFLQNVVYDLIKNDVLIHSNIVGFVHEKITPILFENDNINFVGNVVYYDNNDVETYQFKYNDFPLINHLSFLSNNDQFGLMSHIYETMKINLFSYSINDRNSLLYLMFRAYYYINDIDKVQSILKLYRYALINENIIHDSNFVLMKLKERGYKIIGTTYLNREPNENEIIIYYGNYLHDVNCLPHSNKIYRHAYYFNMVKHDVIEFDSCWNSIDQIYIMNLEERRDRYIEILNELAIMNAPLHKIYHYKAKKEEFVKDNKKLNSYIGATKNHYDVVKHFIDNNYNYCLMLEDDFTFTSNIKNHQKNLKTFFERKYDFDVCLISTSKFHETRPYDDLLSLSYQQCTTTSGYILSKNTAHRVLECFETGVKEMMNNGDYNIYVCDRYWSKLQKDNKFFYFNEKFGYQRCVYSSITNQTNMNFD